MSAIDDQNSLVVDLTYKCNANCRYCQWGDGKSISRQHPELLNVCLPCEKLLDLKTERVVFSGGEPLLRNDLELIVSHYKNEGINSIVVITNGLLLSKPRLLKLIESGLTGIAFSIDSFDPDTANAARGYSIEQLQVIRQNFESTIQIKVDNMLEVGVNVVVSTGNLKGYRLETLVMQLNRYAIDYIKFQPIFDDGYAGMNASELLLHSHHATLLKETGERICNMAIAETNPLEFWMSLSQVLQGKRLVNSTCGLDTRQAILQSGTTKICSWVPDSEFKWDMEKVEETQTRFSELKKTCVTNTSCYCLQNLSHVWETE